MELPFSCRISLPHMLFTYSYCSSVSCISVSQYSSFSLASTFSIRETYFLLMHFLGNSSLDLQRLLSKSSLLQKLTFFINTQSIKLPNIVQNFWICLSYSKTFHLLKLSGTEGLCLTLISYFPTGCIGTLKSTAKMDRESNTQFCTPGIRLKLHSSNPSMRSWALFW